ncbi:MAG: L-threonylcarbamoyladenylate synthase [Fermentimonas sp.]|jgi:L-threonylcarbamoyladenylate synthase
MRDDIQNALEILKMGGLILYPTDTIWGIGCDATNEEAVKKLYSLKRRDNRQSMLILIDRPEQLQAYVREVPDIAWDLIELSDRPLTLIYDGAKNLAPSLIAPDGSIGIRVTNEPFSQTLCRKFRRPIVSTSANISGTPPPARFDQIEGEVKNGVDYIVTYRQDDPSEAKPSGIVKLGYDGTVRVIRE